MMLGRIYPFKKIKRLRSYLDFVLIGREARTRSTSKKAGRLGGQTSRSATESTIRLGR
jgi:hypothetical protein